MARLSSSVWAIVDPSVDPEKVSIRLSNSTAHPVKFWVTGVVPTRIGFELDGNTQWATELVRDPNCKIVEIRQDDLMGPTLVYDERRSD